MFPYFLLLSTCCVLLLPYIFTLPSLNIFAGGCTQSGQLQSKSHVVSGDGSALSSWYPDIGHSALSTLAPASGPRYGQGPDQQMPSRHNRANFYILHLHSSCWGGEQCEQVGADAGAGVVLEILATLQHGWRRCSSASPTFIIDMRH